MLPNVISQEDNNAVQQMELSCLSYMIKLHDQRHKRLFDQKKGLLIFKNFLFIFVIPDMNELADHVDL